MAELLKAKDVNKYLEEEIEKDLSKLRAVGYKPLLAGLRLGDKPADLSYEKAIKKRFSKFDIGYRSLALDPACSDEEILDLIKELAMDKDVHGILLYQPFFSDHDIWKIRQALPPEKDIDGLGLVNLGKVMAGLDDGFASCSASAVLEVMDYYGLDPKGKDVLIIGRGLVVGRPLAMLLTTRSATVSLAHSQSLGLEEKARKADIIVSATGKVGLIDEKFVRAGQILIDLGAGYKDGKIRGDIEADSVKDIVKAYTPVPGGVGGITVNVLIRHLIKACKMQIGK